MTATTYNARIECGACVNRATQRNTTQYAALFAACSNKTSRSRRRRDETQSTRRVRYRWCLVLGKHGCLPRLLAFFVFCRLFFVVCSFLDAVHVHTLCRCFNLCNAALAQFLLLEAIHLYPHSIDPFQDGERRDVLPDGLAEGFVGLIEFLAGQVFFRFFGGVVIAGEFRVVGEVDVIDAISDHVVKGLRLVQKPHDRKSVPEVRFDLVLDFVQRHHSVLVPDVAIVTAQLHQTRQGIILAPSHWLISVGVRAYVTRRKQNVFTG
mmetsp:Transcript_18282/g.38402  ORF Transcript_18282/g.38402 Transcript_18282/m.38402 type:complete len:265 (+) Transcript_18282:1226-2020(+)